MFEFRLGCRFASVALCLSNLHLSSNPSSFSSLFLTSAKENLTFDLARETLVPRTILSPYKSSAAGRRAKERHATSRTFPRVLCHRLASLRYSIFEDIRLFGGLEERSIYIPFVLNIQDQILKGAKRDADSSSSSYSNRRNMEEFYNSSHSSSARIDLKQGPTRLRSIEQANINSLAIIARQRSPFSLLDRRREAFRNFAIQGMDTESEDR